VDKKYIKPGGFPIVPKFVHGRGSATDRAIMLAIRRYASLTVNEYSFCNGTIIILLTHHPIKNFNDYTGGDCQTTVFPIDSEVMEEEGDYPYKYLQDSHENNNNRLEALNILREKNDIRSPWNDSSTSTFQTLNQYNLSTSKSIYALYDRKNGSFTKLHVRSKTYVKFDNRENYKSAKDIFEPAYSKFLRKNPSSKIANGTEQLKRDHNNNLVQPGNSVKLGKFAYSNHWKRNARGLDTYAESLLYVNKIYNAAYGLERRRVPAHMPHLIDKWVMSSMQQKFKSEFKKTSSHKVRDPEDMQFAFSYFYFLTSEKRKVHIGEIFDMFDTDKSR